MAFDLLFIKKNTHRHAGGYFYFLIPTSDLTDF
jgi:hypothetical protein